MFATKAIPPTPSSLREREDQQPHFQLSFLRLHLYISLRVWGLARKKVMREAPGQGIDDWHAGPGDWRQRLARLLQLAHGEALGGTGGASAWQILCRFGCHTWAHRGFETTAPCNAKDPSRTQQLLSAHAVTAAKSCTERRGSCRANQTVWPQTSHKFMSLMGLLAGSRIPAGVKWKVLGGCYCVPEGKTAQRLLRDPTATKLLSGLWQVNHIVECIIYFQQEDAVSAKG